MTPHRDFYLSVFSTFGSDDSPGESRLMRRGRSHGGFLRWNSGGAFSAYLHVSRNDETFPDEPLRERVETDQWGAGLTWRNRRGQTVEVAARRSDGRDRESYTSYSVTWTFPFGMPLGRKQSVGALAGRVFRSDLPGQPGVAGAVVYVDGTAAVTDSGGRFLFRTLAPGAYAVRVDELSVGIGTVAASGGPVEMKVEGGETTGCAIALVASGSLEGRVEHDPARGAAPGGLANMLVELERPGETRRTVTDTDGKFLFQRLVPGEWTLRVYARNLPEQYVLEKERQPVVIGPGARAQATVRTLPRVRQIRFIDSGRIGRAAGR